MVSRDGCAVLLGCRLETSPRMSFQWKSHLPSNQGVLYLIGVTTGVYFNERLVSHRSLRPRNSRFHRILGSHRQLRKKGCIPFFRFQWKWRGGGLVNEIPPLFLIYPVRDSSVHEHAEPLFRSWTLYNTDSRVVRHPVRSGFGVVRSHRYRERRQREHKRFHVPPSHIRQNGHQMLLL